MNAKALIFIGVLVVIAVLVWWSGREKGMEKMKQPSRDMMINESVPHDQPPRATVLPEVKKVVLEAETMDGKRMGPFTFNFGRVEKLPGTDLSIRVSEFYTLWNWSGQAINLSYEEKNPAVKIEILKDGNELYSCWGFKNLPFFRMNSHTMETGTQETGKTEQLAFTLVSYEGLSVPEVDSRNGDEK